MLDYHLQLGHIKIPKNSTMKKNKNDPNCSCHTKLKIGFCHVIKINKFLHAIFKIIFHLLHKLVS